ncbi:unnamed protein product [Mytilus coruscus]|uniref:Uncharacterized protein n=1 Tax=Mytilus coruscus TaxID=42192 RepID=A0A6J8DH58_MYTCO|nr:unnamed protein product [Mytilus coruscus]
MSKFKDLFTFKEEGIADNLLYIDQFYSFIKEKVTLDDKYKINRPNFVREFKGHKEGIKYLSHGNAIAIFSAVRYIFNHLDDYRICHEIGLQISNTAFNSQSMEQTKTLFSLYKAISEFHTKQITLKLNELNSKTSRSRRIMHILRPLVLHCCSRSTEQTKTLFSLYKAISEFHTKQITLKLNKRLEMNCFNHCDLVKPLSLHHFELLQEWILDIPLDIQIILDKFINRDSFYSSGDKIAFLLSKMERLYGAFDILLNTFNKNYIAEKKIKEKATDDLCYYNTYLKRFPFNYQTTTGIADQLVNLRDCHLILMMNNLVRMTFRSDPNPGENRSGQLCTLPLTLQCLPIDSFVTDSWHTTDCLKDQNCQCKKDIKLHKEDFNNALVSLTNEETVSWERFQKLLTWGSSDLLLNADRFEKEYTNDDLSENAEVHQFEKEEYEDNLDSLVQTASLLYQTSE